MRIMQPYGAKPDYYDRRVERVTKVVSPAVQGPHGGTNQWTYTVPSWKLFFVEHLFGLIVRETQASDPSRTTMEIYVTPVGKGPITLLYLHTCTNLVHVPVSMALTKVAVLEEGDMITCLTYDDSEGGSFRYIGTLIGFTFRP